MYKLKEFWCALNFFVEMKTTLRTKPTLFLFNGRLEILGTKGI